MYLKLRKKKEVNKRGTVKLYTVVVPIAVLVFSAMGLNALADSYSEETTEVTTISQISTVTTTETTTEYTTEATTEVTTIEEIIVEPEPAPEPVLSMNTATPSNLNAEQFNILLRGTPLEGDGNVFVDIEKEYGINGLFAVAVAEAETSYGAAGVGSSRNNVFSNTKVGGGYIYFDNKIESIYYFAAYIPRVHWNNGRKYVGDIAPVYCDYTWGNTVEDTMYRLWGKLF